MAGDWYGIDLPQEIRETHEALHEDVDFADCKHKVCAAAAQALRGREQTSA